MKFTPGQKVWVQHDPKEGTGPAGEHAGVVVESHPLPGAYWLEMESLRNPNGRRWWARAWQLRPRDDPPQREQLGEWALCPWKPSLPVTVRANEP